MPVSRRRPAIFLALGHRDPPSEIQVNDRVFQRQRIIKHDSWAATAVYGDGQNGRMICKFNRSQPIGWLPAAWIGRWLARREIRFYKLLADLKEVPAAFDDVRIKGQPAPHAVAHEYVEGHPLRWHDRVDDQFFQRLQRLMDEVHRRGMAYVDMNKWENIIIDADGNPHLIDFQISVRLPRRWPFSLLLNLLQQSDRYHLQKHLVRVRPDLVGVEAEKALELSRPWWIRAHRCFARPFRLLRRGILARLGVRDRKGKPQSEPFVEEGLRTNAVGDTPLGRLYRVLISEDYHAMCAGSATQYVEQMFFHLFNRPADRPADRRLIQRIVDRDSHDIVLALLKSTEVILVSDRWDDQWLQRKTRQIQTALRQWKRDRDRAA